MEKKLSELTVSEFKSLIREIINEEIMNYDPDDGLEVREEVINELNLSIKERQKDKENLLFEEEVYNNIDEHCKN